MRVKPLHHRLDTRVLRSKNTQSFGRQWKLNSGIIVRQPAQRLRCLVDVAISRNKVGTESGVQGDDLQSC